MSLLLREPFSFLIAAEKGRGLVEQILAFSGQRDEDTKVVLMQPLLKGAIKLLQSTIPKSIQISEEITEEPVIITGSATQIYDIIMNILMNAYQAVEAGGGRIRVVLKTVDVTDYEQKGDCELKPGKYGCFIVSDSGHGIPEDIMENVFEPYFTTKKIGKGAGLGLSITHGNVKKAGGSIEVESDPENGTVFKVFLPLISGEEAY